MEKLQDPKQGCLWKRTQTLANIAPYTLEDAYEVADAIARQDWNEPRDTI
jgi:ATP diphosphatase